MPNIFIVTNGYPFLSSEQFLEEEIKYWGDRFTLTILPLRATGSPRKLPDGIKVDRSLSRGSKYKLRLLLYFPLALISKIFYKEVLFLLKNGLFKYNLLREVLIGFSAVMLYKCDLERYVKINGTMDILYFYWNDVSAYAAALVKHKGGIIKLVSRVHGYDLYKERKASGYMPLKWQFTNYFDEIYAVSSQGREYFIKNYPTNPSNIFVAPLGVSVENKNSNKSESGRIHIVSISFCVDVKRIDKIINAIALFSCNNKNLKVSWTHIGGGPLKSSLSALAVGLLGCLNNVSFEFKGDIANEDVRRFLVSYPIDVFVNASESEGVPVSIMEAMAAGIPAVAPDIGGVSNLISDGRGWLLSSNPTTEEIADGISTIYFHPDVDQIRAAAKEKIRVHFNAAKNYPKFIDSVCGLKNTSDDGSPISC